MGRCLGRKTALQTPFFTKVPTAKPPKKKGKVSTDQPVPRSTREGHPSEKAFKNGRISKNIASKKQTTAKKKQNSTTIKALRQAAEAALLTKQA